MKKLVEALRDPGPITPQLAGPSQYQRNAQLVEIARCAARGSMLHLSILCRMSEANRLTALTYSKAETKEILRSMIEGIENG